MQFSEKWLRTMVNPEMTSDELSHLLTMAGLEVEEVEPVAPPFTNIVVGEVLEVAQHPDADRLHVCQVNVNTGTILNIVCGAPNVRPGLKVPCAMVGAVLPPGPDGKPFEIKVSKLRGVESQGMLCSARELKLSDDHGGLLELPDDAPVGQNFRDYFLLNDLKFLIKLTPNKADCLSLLGVAREVSALTGAELKLPTYKKAVANIFEKLPVKVSAPDLCGRFAGRIIRHVNAKAKTPFWMVRRLERSGIRSVSALVDISNYVMLELGQPSHVFDLDKIKGGLEVRWGKAGEQVKLLNGNTVDINEWYGVVADDNGIESIAGIMGGDATAVSLETTDIYVEAAFWHPSAIQGRARKLNFSTDAAHRFERGVDFGEIPESLERITALVLEICGIPETKVGPIDDQIINLPARTPVKLRTARASKVIGIPFTDEQIGHIFNRLGLKFINEPGLFSVVPPSYRFDIEIEEDLIEEVARVYGFENIPALPPVAANIMHIGPEHIRSQFDIRREFADFDYQEVVNYSFVDKAWEKDFADNNNPIRLLNPIASQMSVMRSSLLASLVANAKYNINRKASRIRIFEIADVFTHDEKVEDGPLSVAGIGQVKHLAALAYGPVVEEQWGVETRLVDFFDVKADLEALFAPVELRFTKAAAHPALHPGRSADVYLNDKKIGIIGELHPKLQQQYDLPHPAILLEVTLASLQEVPVPSYKDISKFPAVSRDLALVVKQKVAAQSLLDIFKETKQSHKDICNIIQKVVLFDEYQGKGLEGDEKSLAFRFTLQDDQNTLQDTAIEAAMDVLVKAATEKLSAKLRA